MKRFKVFVLCLSCFILAFTFFITDKHWDAYYTNKEYFDLPQTQAIMQRIDYDRENGIKVIVKYFVDGNEYDAILNEKAVSLEPGQEITVYYSADNKEKVFLKHEYTDKLSRQGQIGLYIMVLTGVVAAIALGSLIIEFIIENIIRSI